MDAEELRALFETAVAQPLQQLGFRRHGQSFYIQKGPIQAAWIRYGGRFVFPGSLAQVVCVRHSLLRTMEEVVPSSPPRHAKDYPWVFDPGALDSTGPADWEFRPQRLMRLPFRNLEYAHLSAQQVSQFFERCVENFAGRYMPWAEDLSPTDGVRQMKSYSQEWWIARLWLEDYAQTGNP